MIAVPQTVAKVYKGPVVLILTSWKTAIRRPKHTKLLSIKVHTFWWLS